MKYSIKLAKEAASDLETLYKSDRKIFDRILANIECLAEMPKNGKALTGNHKGEYSLRAGKYRIIYELDTKKHIVYILTVKHRKHVY
jgi:mRNA interferase RelE/StbE